MLNIKNIKEISEKERLVTLLLCWFLGIFGVHRFYIGKTCTGLLMLFTLGIFGIWTFIDLIIILIGKMTDSEGKVIERWTN